MFLPIDSDAPAADLARFDDEWAKTSVPADEMYGDIPDGSYDAVIEGARVTETTSSARPVVIWKLRIQGPQAVNRVVTKNRVITDNTLGYLREDLEKCGLQVSRLSEVSRPLGRIGRSSHLPRSAHKDGRTNFYFRWGSNRTSQGDSGRRTILDASSEAGLTT